jgi:hypothetical protein
MSIVNILFTLAVVAALWGTVAAVMITKYLEKKGVKTPFVLFRLFLFRNIRRYKEITIQETGKPGPLYNHYIIPFNAALLLVLAALAVRFF